MFTKDNLNDEIKKSIFIGHGDFPPNPDDYPEPEMYMAAMQIWEADKNKDYFGIELVSEPNADYTGGKTTFATKNVSDWAAVETSPDENLAMIEGKLILIITIIRKIRNAIEKSLELVERKPRRMAA